MGGHADSERLDHRRRPRGALFVPAAAQAAALACTFTPRVTQTSWLVPSDVQVAFDGASRAASLDFNPAPGRDRMDGRIISANADRMIMRFDQSLRNSSGQRTRMRYRLAVTLATGEAQVTATPRGYSNAFFFDGRCNNAG